MNPLWLEIAARAGALLNPEQDRLLAHYIDLLLEANQRMNLTRITGREAAEVHHVGDALTLLKFIPSGPLRLADVGSGGGVPGIPIAIVRPDVQALLIEATGKKAAFLADVSGRLGLRNIQVVASRAEEAGRSKELRQTCDVVVARAVATMDWLAEWCLPLLKTGGKLLAMKGPKSAQELPAAKHAIGLLGGSTPLIHPADLPGAENHVIVEIRKTHGTPAAFPRPASRAKHRPLE